MLFIDLSIDPDFHPGSFSFLPKGLPLIFPVVGNTEDPKQVELKQAHTKTCYKKGGKKLKIKRGF